MSFGGEKIRVLIVDDIPDTRENLRKLLYFEKDIEVVAAASSGEEAIEFAKEYQPHIVLMDINMPGVDGISASEAIAREAPATQVIMMSVQSEADYLRRSMLAGARDFLTKPFSGDELVGTIRRVHETRRVIPQPAPVTTGQAQVAAPARADGKVIAVFSPKGGTGCTVLAVNLAIAMQRVNKGSVVLIEGSLQFGDIAVTLDLQPTHTIYDLMPTIDEMDAGMVETVLSHHSGGIKVLLAPSRPELAEYVPADNLQRVLEQLKRQFDYVVVDTGTALDDTVLTVLDLSDMLVLVTTPDIPALKNVRLVFEVTEKLSYPLDKIVMVLNKSDAKRSRIRVSDIEESIRHPVAIELPLDDAVPLSVNQGVPFVLRDSSSPISQAVIRLADKVIETWAVTESEAEAEAEFDDETRRRLGRFFR